MADTNRYSNSKKEKTPPTEKKKSGGQPGNQNALKYSDEKYVPLVNQYYDDMLAQGRYPSDEYLSVYMDINQDTIYEWIANHPRFRVAVARGRNRALQALCDRSLTGEWNDRFVAFLMKNRHGYSDKVEQKVEADVGVRIVFSEES